MNWSILKFSNESELENIILRNKVLENHHAYDFKNSISPTKHYNRHADLIVVQSDHKYWSIVEVEFSNHSFRDHIFPQLLEIHSLIDQYYLSFRDKCLLEKSIFQDKETIDLIQFNKPFLTLIIDRIPHQYSSSIPLINTFCNIITVNRGWDKFENYFYLCDYYMTNHIKSNISYCYITENILVVERPNIIGLNDLKNPFIYFNEDKYEIHQQIKKIDGSDMLFWYIDGSIRNGRYTLKLENGILTLKRG